MNWVGGLIVGMRVLRRDDEFPELLYRYSNYFLLTEAYSTWLSLAYTHSILTHIEVENLPQLGLKRHQQR